MLRSGLLAGTAVASAGAMSAIFAGPAKAATPDPQPDWGYCKYCATMWWTPGQANSACAAYGSPIGSKGWGTHGVSSGSSNYAMYNNQGGLTNKSNPQPNWRWCNYCQGLFWGGNGGVCQGNEISGNGVVQLGAHEAGGTNYDLLFNGSGLNGSTNPQAYWRYCVQCSLLYWQGASGTEAGACPAGVKHYDGGSSTNYNVLSESTY